MMFLPSEEKINGITLADGTTIYLDDLKNGDVLDIKAPVFKYDEKIDDIIGFYDYAGVKVSLSEFESEALEVDIMKCKFIVPADVLVYYRNYKEWKPITFEVLKRPIYIIVGETIMVSSTVNEIKKLGKKKFTKISDVYNNTFILTYVSNTLTRLPVKC